VALFFNDELAASTHIEEVSQRIAAAEAAVVTAMGDAAPKKVLWVYEYYGTLYSGSCPNYYCEAIAQAGGEIMDLSSIGDPAAWGGITNFTLFYEMAAEADIWLYPSNNWDAVSLDADALSLLPAVMNDQVYDITGNNLCMDGDCDTANDWFESRLAEPDVLLEDLISIIMPEVHMDHGRVWFRNVATEERGSARTCSDPASPYLFHADDVVPGAAADAICVEDLTGDGIVGVDDLLQLLSAYGRGC
jgi:iron complex transport system substrate-binding protein